MGRADWIVQIWLCYFGISPNETDALKRGLDEHYDTIFTGGEVTVPMDGGAKAARECGIVTIVKASSQENDRICILLCGDATPLKAVASTLPHGCTFGTKISVQVSSTGNNLYIKTSVEQDWTATLVNNAVAECKDKEQRIGANLPALVCFRYNMESILVYIKHMSGDVYGLQTILKIEIDLEERVIKVENFFYHAPVTVVKELKKHANAQERTLSGIAMEWIRAIAIELNIIEIKLIDQWTGTNNKKTIDSATLKKFEQVRQRRAQYHVNDAHTTDELNEDMARAGYYGLWGFQGKYEGKSVDPKKMRVLRNWFCDLAIK